MRAEHSGLGDRPTRHVITVTSDNLSGHTVEVWVDDTERGLEFWLDEGREHFLGYWHDPIISLWDHLTGTEAR